MFEQEIEILGLLQHHCIPRLHGTFTDHEFYSTDSGGQFPSALSALVPRYIEAIHPGTAGAMRRDASC